MLGPGGAAMSMGSTGICTNGNVGGNYGGGGGGGACITKASGLATGGTGAPGVVRVTEFK